MKNESRRPSCLSANNVRRCVHKGSVMEPVQWRCFLLASVAAPGGIFVRPWGDIAQGWSEDLLLHRIRLGNVRKKSESLKGDAVVWLRSNTGSAQKSEIARRRRPIYQETGLRWAPLSQQKCIEKASAIFRFFMFVRIRHASWERRWHQ